MKQADPTTFGPRNWSRTGRPVRPYLIDPVVVTTGPEPHPSRSTSYLLDPIHPRLLAVQPGNSSTFITLATELGLQEFFDWLGPLGLPIGSPMLEVIERYDTGYRSFTRQALAAAWTDDPVVQATKVEQDTLRRGFRAAQTDDTVEAARRMLATGWEAKAFTIDLHLDEAAGIVYEQPHHIWSRAWFELLEGLRGKQLPITCEYCGERFIPRKRNAAFCVGTNCQQRAYDKRRAKTLERRKYQREYKKKERSKGQPKTGDDNKNQGGR
jgi:hypothetical protein